MQATYLSPLIVTLLLYLGDLLLDSFAVDRIISIAVKDSHTCFVKRLHRTFPSL